MLLLFIALVALLSAQIWFQHFTPFEKDANWNAVRWGARPAPRFWAVAGLDAVTWLLGALLVLGGLPALPADHLIERAAIFVPAWLACTALAAFLHRWINLTVIRFPRYRLIATRLAVALGVGAGLVLAVLLTLGVTITASAPGALGPAVAAVFAPALLIALFAYALRALAFNLRLVPVIGAPLHAAASTGILWLAVTWMGGALMRALGRAGEAPGLVGLELPTQILMLLGGALALLGYALAGAQREADAVDPPDLLVDVPAPGSTAAQDGEAVTISGRHLRVRASAAPLAITVTDASGATLLALDANSFGRRRVLHAFLSIPVLYTGNTMKSWLRLPPAAVTARDARVEGDALVIPLDSGALRIRLHDDDTVRLTLTPAAGLTAPNAASLSFDAPCRAHWLGFGQRFDRIDQTGQDIYFLVEEGGVGFEWLARKAPWLRTVLEAVFGARGSFPNGEHCTGFPVPFGILAREDGPSVGLFWNTYRPSWFASDAKRPMLTVLDDQLDVFITRGPTPLDCVAQYSGLTGRPLVPPPWAFLPWKTNTGAVVEADAHTDMRKFRELGIPLAQIGIEHWQDVRGSYEFSPQWWPNIGKLLATAKRNDFRVHVWHFPYMNAGSATHAEGVRAGHFVRNRLGLPYQQRIFHGISTVVDYTNPRARAWHADIVKTRFHDRGIDAAMTDYAESIPPDSVFYNGASGLALRNAYPVMYCDTMQQAARASLGEDYCIYPRAGYAASQRYVNAMWPGDQDTDWDDGDGLPAAVRAMLNASLCGFPVHGSDVGGWYDWFAPITTKELYLRWAEVGAYSPLMRAHGGPIGRNREPWKFDAETVEIYRALSEAHVQLFPYLYSLAAGAARTGRPVIRHPALLWPERPELYAIEDAWLIGDALYVAPVIEPGKTSRAVTLPPGEWWLLSEGRSVTGGQTITVDAPFGRVPVFLRRGYCVPRFVTAFDNFAMRPDAMAMTAAADNAQPDLPAARIGGLNDALSVQAYPAADGSVADFELWDGQVLRHGQPATGRTVTWVTVR